MFEHNLLKLAASLEKPSGHPLSSTIVDGAAESSTSLSVVGYTLRLKAVTVK